MAEHGLASMKIDQNAREEKYKLAETSAAPDGSQYPYGLQLQLDDEALDKLGIETLPRPDTEIVVYARATVTSVSSNASTGGEKRRSVSLQITDLSLETATKKKSNADVLFKE